MASRFVCCWSFEPDLHARRPSRRRLVNHFNMKNLFETNVKKKNEEGT